MKKMKKTKRIKKFSFMDELMASPIAPLSNEYRMHQLTRMYEGLNALETAPAPSVDDWVVVADAVNLMETLICTMRICEDESGLLNDAIAAMQDASKRHACGSKSLRLSGKGIQAVRAVLEDYAAIVEVVPARTMINCHRLTEQRLHEILDGKKQPHDYVWGKE